MKANRWLMFTGSLLLVGIAAVVTTSYWMDLFGLFHNPAGRVLSVNDNVRTSKFLLNERYVPTNFDGVLIGGSSTMNWDLTKLDFARFYNESIAGANVLEEKRLVDQALPNAHFKYAVCLISASFVRGHVFNEGNGKPTHREALGSVNVLREELASVLHRVRHAPPRYYPNGSEDIVAPVRLNLPLSSESFSVDPVALEAYRDLLNELRQRGVKIIFLRAPYYGPLYNRDQRLYDSFYASFPLRLPGEPMVDFGGSKYSALRENAENWNSVGHLSHNGGIQAAADLNAEIHRVVPGLASEWTSASLQNPVQNENRERDQRSAGEKFNRRPVGVKDASSGAP